MKYFKNIIILFFIFVSCVDAKELKKTVVAEIDNALFANILETKDNGYFAVGSNFVDNTWFFPAQMAVKLDKTGNIEWQYRDDYLFSYFIKASETIDDGYVVVGNRSDPSDCNIIKFDKNGEVLWQHIGCKIDNDRYAISDFYDVLVDDEDIIAIGDTQYYISEYDTTSSGYIVKYDNDGNELWKSKAPTEGTNYSNIAILSDGTYLVTGATYQNQDYSCGYVVNYDKNGKVLSEETHCESGKNILFEDIYNYDGNVYLLASIGGKGYRFVSNEKKFSTISSMKVGGDYYIIEYDDELHYDKKIQIIATDTKEANFYLKNGYFFSIDYLLEDYYLSDGTYEFDGYSYNVELNFFDYDKNLLLDDKMKIHNINVNEDVNKLLIGSVSCNKEASKLSDIFNTTILKYELVYDIKKEETSNGTFDVTSKGNLGEITITPDEGYTLGGIFVADSMGQKVEYYEENGNYYFELYDDVEIMVSFIENVVLENPNTKSFIELGILGLLLISVFILKNSSRNVIGD